MGLGSGRVELKEGVEKFDEGSRWDWACWGARAGGEGEADTDIVIIITGRKVLNDGGEYRENNNVLARKRCVRLQAGHFVLFTCRPQPYEDTRDILP